MSHPIVEYNRSSKYIRHGHVHSPELKRDRALAQSIRLVPFTWNPREHVAPVPTRQSRRRLALAKARFTERSQRASW